MSSLILAWTRRSSRVPLSWMVWKSAAFFSSPRALKGIVPNKTGSCQVNSKNLSRLRCTQVLSSSAVAILLDNAIPHVVGFFCTSHNEMTISPRSIDKETHCLPSVSPNVPLGLPMRWLAHFRLTQCVARPQRQGGMDKSRLILQASVVVQEVKCSLTRRGHESGVRDSRGGPAVLVRWLMRSWRGTVLKKISTWGRPLQL